MVSETDELSFMVVHHYPSVRKFVIQKPLKKSFVDSFKELLVGKG